MAASRSDLPLERDASARVLPWVIAVMVYLATLAIEIGRASCRERV